MKGLPWSSWQNATGVATSNAGNVVSGAQNAQGVAVTNVAQSQVQTPAQNQPTNIIPFVPSSTANFTFAPTLDGSTYNVIVNWGLFGQRYYINIYTVNGKRVLTLPLIGSPDDFDINLLGGYFKTRMIFRASSQSFEIA